jgi:hypothetical protein
MTTTKTVILVGLTAIGVGVVVWRASRTARLEPTADEPAESSRPAPTESPPPPPPPAKPDADTRPTVAVAARPHSPTEKSLDDLNRTEAALMTRLRDLSGSEPALSLQLAREGNLRFKDSPDEAERRWYIVRSLMNLGRPEEARAEARVLLDQYPTSEWAQDVHRHLFVNPPTHPLERGYGKTLELE